MDFKEKFEKAYSHFLDYLAEADYSTMVTEKFEGASRFFIEYSQKQYISDLMKTTSAMWGGSKIEETTETSETGYALAKVEEVK